MTSVLIKVPTRVDDWYCDRCKSWFDSPYVHEWDEPRGEYWGIPCSEHMYEKLCPKCKSADIYEADDLYIIDEEEEEDE